MDTHMICLVCTDARARSSASGTERERILYWQPTGLNPLNHRDDLSGPALRHWSLNSLFQGERGFPGRHGRLKSGIYLSAPLGAFYPHLSGNVQLASASYPRLLQCSLTEGSTAGVKQSRTIIQNRLQRPPMVGHRTKQTTLETAQGQIDGLISQLRFKCYLPEVASVGD